MSERDELVAWCTTQQECSEMPACRSEGHCRRAVNAALGVQECRRPQCGCNWWEQCGSTAGVPGTLPAFDSPSEWKRRALEAEAALRAHGVMGLDEREQRRREYNVKVFGAPAGPQPCVYGFGTLCDECKPTGKCSDGVKEDGRG